MKTILTTMLALIAFNTYARTPAMSSKMICHTPRLDKAFVVGATQVTFLDESLEGPERQLASVEGIRTKVAGNGFTKIMDFEGQRHTIHVADMNNPSQVEDYLVIRSREGHELTYPLDCSRVE